MLQRLGHPAAQLIGLTLRPSVLASTVLCSISPKRSAPETAAITETFTAIAHCQSTGDIFMDEARTLAVLAWIIGWIVGVLFVLQAIALSLS